MGLLHGTAAALLRQLDPETAHGLTLWGLRHGLGPRDRRPDDPCLATWLWGRDFANPVGLAAGFDKQAAAMGASLAMGFGFVEVGSITPRAQPGNPRPRLFRLAEDRAVINRFGFNSEGMAAAAARLRRWRESGHSGARPPGVVGVNLGKNRDTGDAAMDYAAGAVCFGGLADYLVVNVSSPNTPGLRALQGRAELEDLLDRVRGALAAAGTDRNGDVRESPPLLLKIAPDLSATDKADIAAVALEQRLAGLVVGNTTVARPAGLRGLHRGEAGGLSGRPLFAPSTALLAEMYRLTGGRVPLVGVGGIASGADAYAKVRAGASLVQLYSALVFEGPGLVPRIKRDLAALLRRDGFAHVADAVGADHAG